VLSLQKTNNQTTLCVSLNHQAPDAVENLLTKEWLLTNTRGGYASSTIIGCNTKRYHGLLVGSLNPPANRIMALANCLEMLIIGGAVCNLSTFEFTDKFAPQGTKFLRSFRRDTGAHFDYNVNGLQLTKSVYLLCETDTLALVYTFSTVRQPLKFVLRPFVGLRDFHALQKSYAPLCARDIKDGLLVRHDVAESCELLLKCPDADFEKDPQWWFNFVYRNDKQRGQDFTEDLWTPGFFSCRLDKPAQIVLWANLVNQSDPQHPADTDLQTVLQHLHCHQENVISSSAAAKDQTLKTLCLAADQFVVKRHVNNHRRFTILAGFPWFADWGRDAFLALPGLLLSTGRFEEAASVLTTFARAADAGMIPNRFDDHSDTAYFNSIDASLWFINAAFEYLGATNDTKTFTRNLLPAIRWIIDSYQKGTRFGIHADTDGLITAGNDQNQLTWMDAKYNGVAFTPRCGKAVEINALWYNGLCCLSGFYARRDPENELQYRSLAEKVQAGFRALFWNTTTGYLNDCVSPNGSVDTSLRPNQIFAVSLPFSPLPRHQQKSVVEVVRKNLLTPYGLRTLDPHNSRYQGIYTGPQQQRDRAYHQGTVWPYLIGPFVQAYLRVNQYSRKSKKNAAEFLAPLLRHINEKGCLGQLGEIFDGDSPHTPRGCFAQAGSVAEVIRAYHLIYD